MSSYIQKFKKHQFLFEELVKRDFKHKYKDTVLGMGWSILSPLLMLLVMKLVFENFFGRTVHHYTIYLFCGNIVFTYFVQSTQEGMRSLVGNAKILQKINLPKYLFLLSKNVSTFINFLLTACILFAFVVGDGISVNWRFLALIFPIGCLVLFNIGVGLTLSALFVFYRDINYLYKVVIRLMRYVSAIFYPIDIVPAAYMKFFYLNPVYCYIEYFRTVIIDGKIPSPELHLLCAFYACLFIGIGSLMYKKFNSRFIYYL